MEFNLAEHRPLDDYSMFAEKKNGTRANISLPLPRPSILFFDLHLVGRHLERRPSTAASDSASCIISKCPSCISPAMRKASAMMRSCHIIGERKRCFVFEYFE